MSESSRLVALNTGRSSFLRGVACVVVSTIFVLVPPFGTTKADSQQYFVVARVDAKSPELAPGEVVVKIGNMSVLATAIRTSPDSPRNIAIVMDAGPDQANVLSREKELAIALINDLFDASTSFTIASVGTLSKTQATTLDRSVAIQHIREIVGDTGKKSNVAIYDAIGSAILQISLSPGFRVVIFIGEGNDGAAGCGMRSCVAWQSQIKSPSWPRLLRTTVFVAQRASFDMGGPCRSSPAIPPACS